MKFPNKIEPTCSNCLWVVRQKSMKRNLYYTTQYYRYECNLNNAGLKYVYSESTCPHHTRVCVESRTNALIAMERFAWYISRDKRVSE